MNCVAPFVTGTREQRDQPALWMPGSGSTTFGELMSLATRARAFLAKTGVGVGDSVLLLDRPSPRLYACLLAIFSRGAAAVLVEPWMPVSRIERAVDLMHPKLFLGGALAMLWGARVKAVRKIGTWARLSRALKEGARESLDCDDVPETTPGVITFTSGTTGVPKGVVRAQGYLVKQHEVLSRHLESARYRGADLCIFANFVLSNLASTRASVLLPAPFDESALRALASLPAALRPQTMTAGPAFLERLMEVAPLKSLQSIHVGGALSDCALWDRAFRAWPEARFVHLYGSSEAEPVAHADARVSVEKSRARKLFQALFLGEFVPEIAPRLEPEGLWIAGPHVCPRYLSDDEENRRSKQEDAQGTLWHFMGDRVVRDEAGLWYAGRSGQPQEDFQLEQRVYARLESSASFVTLDSEGRWWLVGEEVQANREAIRREFPEIHDVAEARILRDRRHRARIDRSATLRKAAPWLAG